MTKDMTKDMTKEFPLNRYKHCYNVGRKMYYYAKEVLKLDEEKCKQMFFLGNIHDIGYFLDSNKHGHDKVLADCLNDTYKYSKEIEFHSNLNNDYQSEELDLLYYADMTVDGQGNWCSYEERIKDIKNRYGENSETLKEVEETVIYLKNKGYDDTFNI